MTRAASRCHRLGASSRTIARLPTTTSRTCSAVVTPAPRRCAAGTSDSQAIVLMMLPSALVELLEELEFELPRSAIELSMNDEMIDCADSALVEDVVPGAVLEEFALPPVRALNRL